MKIGDLDIANFMLGDTQVEKICLGSDLVWPTDLDYRTIPLTFEIISGGTIGFRTADSSETFTRTIEYNLNGGGWQEVTSTSGGSFTSVVPGDIIQFRGNNSKYATGTGQTEYTRFVAATARFKAYGNIMSLVDATNFKNVSSVTSNYAFARLFYSTGIVDAGDLVMPTGLKELTFFNTFEGCSKLTVPPKLNATTLGRYCYYGMFGGCTGLTYYGDELPARVLEVGCYMYMFNGCTNLAEAPALPATTLAASCYSYMFNGCSNLHYIACLATDITASSCVRNWVSGVPASGDGLFIKNQDMASWPRGNSGIPNNWQVIDW